MTRKLTNRSLIKYHRQAGLFVALLAVILSITGLLLQHTDTFGFGRYYLRSPWLLSWYNTPAPDIKAIYLKQHEIVQVDDALLLNGTVIGQSNGQLWGATHNGETLLIGSGSKLFWLTPEAELIDLIDTPTHSPQGLAHQQANFQLKTEQGWFSLGSELEHWTPNPTVNAAPLAQLHSLTIQQVALPSNLPVGVTVERLLLDLHSGRFFGAIGILLMDLAALALVLLAFTGLWVWLRKR